MIQILTFKIKKTNNLLLENNRQVSIRQQDTHGSTLKCFYVTHIYLSIHLFIYLRKHNKIYSNETLKRKGWQNVNFAVGHISTVLTRVENKVVAQLFMIITNVTYIVRMFSIGTHNFTEKEQLFIRYQCPQFSSRHYYYYTYVVQLSCAVQVFFYFSAIANAQKPI